MNTFELIKSDLNEFTTTMKNDINEVSMQFQDNSLIKSLNLSKHVNEYNIVASKSNTSNNHANAIYDRFKDELRSLQNSQDTYLNDLNNDYLEAYLKWKQNFDPDTHKGTISGLLIENATMRSLYSQLVIIQIFIVHI